MHATRFARPRAVLNFWYGEFEPIAKVSFVNAPLWYKKDPEFDSKIKALFEDDINKASEGLYDEWADESSVYGVALVVLLDQFSRNMYRDTPQMFAYDSKALQISNKLIDKGWDFNLPMPMKCSLYLPFMHSENITDQQKVVKLSEGILATTQEATKPQAVAFHKFALEHQRIIQLFGRFPHRNSILGRKSTLSEVEFLQNHAGF